MQPFPTTPTSIILADGVERHLRYSLGAVKRIKEQFGKTFTEILNHPPEEFLPKVIMEGLVEKTGMTEDRLREDPELLTAPMVEYAQLCFVEAFFGVQQRHVIDALLTRNRALLEERIGAAIKPEPELEPEPAPPEPVVQ